MINAQTWNHFAKREDKDRDCQYQAGPELCRERSHLTILFFLARNADLWLEPHSTDWAITGVVLLDLRMHWTGVDGLICWRTIGRIAFQTHTALLAITWLIRFNPASHRTEITITPCQPA